MQGIYLKIFVPEALRHDGDLLYEWVLRKAQSIGMTGGSASRAIAGFGRHGQLHEQHFFELAGELPIILDFFSSEHQVNDLLTLLKEVDDSLIYIKFNAEAGQTKPSS